MSVPAPSRGQQFKNRMASGQGLSKDWGRRLWHFFTAKDEAAYASAVAPQLDSAAPGRDWLQHLLFQMRPAYRQTVVMAFVINILGLLTALFSLQVYDRVVAHAGYSSLVALVLGMLFVVVVDYTMRHGRALLLQRVGGRLEVAIARSVFQRLMHLPALELEKRNATYWQSVFRDIELVRSTCSGGMALLIIDVPFLLLSLVMIGLIALPVLPFAFLTLVAFGVLAWMAGRDTETKSQQEKERVLSRDATIAELGQARMHLKAMGADLAATQRWETHYARWMADSLERSRENDRYRDLATEMTVLNTVVVTSVGALAILSQLMTMGSLIAANILGGKMVAPLVQLVGQWRAWGQFLAAKKRLGDLLDTPLDRTETDVRMPRPVGALVMENISFSYPGSKHAQILELSGQLGAGGLHAIVGPNGSGKSTLLKLLRGLYVPAQGRVLIDGADMAQFAHKDLARWVGYLPQQVQLLSGTVRENIAISDQDADDAQIIRAAKLACAHEFLIDLPDGYGSPVGDGGGRFSGGQRKRIAIAQVLLHDPVVLLLDEPTADLDPAAEQSFVATLKEMAKDHTIVVVTHSPYLLRQCQGILVMDKGKLVMAGPAAKVLPKLGLAAPAAQEVSHAV
ncbi:MAG: peptidase domain-containing ABC transporter [Pseudomonadota bacterium]